jgi:hypothetical protein
MRWIIFRHLLLGSHLAQLLIPVIYISYLTKLAEV